MSLVLTRLQNLRAQTNIDKWEVRASRWGFFDLFRSQTMSPMGIINNDLQQKAIDAVGSTLEIPVIDFNPGVTVTNVTQPVVITGVENTSKLYAVTFTDYYFSFLIYPAQHKNNEISMQRDFNQKLTERVYKLADILDIACGASLEANKTQVLTDTLGGRYSLVSDVVVAPNAEAGAFVGDINPLFSGNDFFGPVDMAANGSLESHVRNTLLEKGQFNSENKQYQFNDKVWYFTNNLANGAGHVATGYAVQQNSVGYVQQFSPDCVMGHSTHKHNWSIETLPFLGIPIGTYSYDDAVDASSLNASTTHLTATKVEAYGFHMRMAFLVAYNSDPATRASSIMKIALASA